MSRAERTRRSLLLGPGMALVAVALVNLLQQVSVVGWTLAVGLVLLLTYAGASARARRLAPGR